MPDLYEHRVPAAGLPEAAASADAFLLALVAGLARRVPVASLAALVLGSLPADLAAGLAARYTKTETDAAIAAGFAGLIGAAPATLNALDELAAALGNDPAFATSMATALGNRLRVDGGQSSTAAQKTLARANAGLVIGADVAAASHAHPMSDVTGLAAALASINSGGAVTAATGWTRTSTTLAGMATNLDYTPQLPGSAGCNVLMLVQGTIDGAAAATSARAYLQPWFSLGGLNDNTLSPAVMLGLSRLAPTTGGHAVPFQTIMGGRLTSAQRNNGTTYRVHVAGAVAEAGTTLTISRVQALYFEG